MSLCSSDGSACQYNTIFLDNIPTLPQKCFILDYPHSGLVKNEIFFIIYRL